MTAAVPLDESVDGLAAAPGGGAVLVVLDRGRPGGDDAADVRSAPAEAWRPRHLVGGPAAPRTLELWAVGAHRTLARTGIVATGGWNVWQAALSDDGTIAAVASRDTGESGWYAPALLAIDPDGVAVAHEPEPGVQLGEPAIADGVIGVIEGFASDRGVVAGDVLLVGPEGVRRVDTDGVDVTSLSAVPGTGAFVFAGLRGLETVAGRIDVRTGRATPAWSSAETLGGRVPRVRADGQGRLVGMLESYDRHPQLVRMTADGSETLLDLDHDGARAARATGGRVEALKWSAPDGLPVEGLVVLPDGDGPFPLVLNVHGGPVASWRNRWGMQNGERHPHAALLAAAGIATLHPNPRGSTGRGQVFARRVRGDMLGADIEDLFTGIDHLVARGLVDPARVGITGNSYGGLMTCWLVATTDRFRAAMATSPVTHWATQHHTTDIPAFDELFLDDDPERVGGAYETKSPLQRASGVTTPTLLTAGTRDTSTPPEQAIAFHQALSRRGIETELVLYPRQGHGISGFPETTDFLERLLDWFARHLGAPAGS